MRSASVRIRGRGISPRAARGPRAVASDSEIIWAQKRAVKTDFLGRQGHSSCSLRGQHRPNGALTLDYVVYVLSKLIFKEYGTIVAADGRRVQIGRAHV